MRAIEICALDNGAHRNQMGLGVLPDGWALIPDDMVCENFPFGTVTVEEIGGVPTVAGWTPGVIPIPEPGPEETPSISDRLTALEAKAEQAKIDRAALIYLLTGEEGAAT